jgi:membrane protein YqaA with SNARE-associated domain
MENSSTPNPSATIVALPPADGISLRRWFAAYALWLVAACVALAALVPGSGSWTQWLHQPVRTFVAASPVAKLIGFTLYLSLCFTFLPLPTGWIVAALATREAALTGGLTSTVLAVALAGALGSTIANLNDYYIFTAMLRLHRVAAVRHTRTYHAAAKWFAKWPFSIILIFNIVPIPLDVVRMLATVARYSRPAFAAANFIGRFFRYAVIAFATYYWNLGWIAPVALLALAAVLGIGRVASGLMKKRAADKSRVAN